MTKRIVKVGLCVLRNGALLLARSAKDGHFQIPGGKIESGETDVDALAREALEELSISLFRETVSHLETFEAAAAGRPGVTVEVRLYQAEFAGDPRPSSEIAELHWQPLTGAVVESSDIVRQKILPYLAAQNP